jgi:exodeoxyribonuclease VII large subunit
LAVFNDEQLVRTIAASRVPTLVGVGHEVDISLADLAADVRAATPSNAAQLLVPDRAALLAELAQREQRLADRITTHIERVSQTVAAAPQHMFERLQARLADYTKQIAQAESLLKQLNPKVVLQRGYALVRDQKGNIVKNDAKITPGTVLTIELARAIIRAGVIDAKQKQP